MPKQANEILLPVLKQVFVSVRQKRQSPQDTRLRESGGAGRYKNECQNNQVVDCADQETVRYTCNTGALH